MDTNNKNLRGRAVWLLFSVGGLAVSAALRRWQLGSAFEEETGLAIPWAPASVILTCVLVMAAAWFVLLGAHQPIAKRPVVAGQVQSWDAAFLEAGDLVYPVLVIGASVLMLVSVPLLLKTGFGQWQIYQEAVKAQAHQLPSNNGALTLATAGGNVLAFLGLLQIGRDGIHSGRRGKGGFSAVLPGVAGCIWLMESFRGHAANPVQWDYAPLILAISCGMLFYMDFAGVASGTGSPRRLLCMAAMTVVLAGPAMVSAWVEGSPADVLMLLSQALTAAAVMWRLPPNLQNPPKVNKKTLSRPDEVSI